MAQDQDNNSGSSKRGFAAMDPDRQREIARKGGITAHEKGRAHEWDPEEARDAGHKGGQARSSGGQRAVLGQDALEE